MSRISKELNYLQSDCDELIRLKKQLESNFCNGDNILYKQFGSYQEKKTAFENELDKVNNCILIYDKLISAMRRIMGENNQTLQEMKDERNDIAKNHNKLINELIEIEKRLTMNQF